MARVELSLELNQIVNRVDQREWSLSRDGLNAGNIELPNRGSAPIMYVNVIPRSVEERRHAEEGPIGLETYLGPDAPSRPRKQIQVKLVALKG